MKGILVIIDGLGDLPCKELGGKTPLEAAEKPNLDYLASRGELGYMYPVKEGFVPESDVAVLSILGNKVIGSDRGQFEAIGSGVDLTKGDLALRTNFATVDNLKNKKVIDRRAGRTLTTKEARLLADAVNKNVRLPCKFVFKNTVQHRGVLILRGGFSDNITNTDSFYHKGGKVISGDKFKFSQPLDDDENTDYTSDLINSFTEQSHKILESHIINKERRKRGLLAANIILTRDASTGLPEMKKLRSFSAIVYMPLEIGIAKASGMDVFSFPYPEMRGSNIYENLYSGLDEACKFTIKTIKKEAKNYDYFYVHFKESDIPGHDNKPEEKKKMVEFLDKNFFPFLRGFEKNKIKVLVTADHSTPCRLKSHSSDAVPVLFCDWNNNEKKEFSEISARKGELGKIYGRDILKLLL